MFAARSSGSLLNGVSSLAALLILTSAWSVAWAQSPASNVKRFTLSNHVPPSHNVAQASDRFAAAVKERSNGSIDIQVRHAAQLAGLRAAAEGVQLGTIDIVWADLATLANWVPEYGFMVLPFLLDDFDHVFRVLYGPTGNQIRDDVRKRLGIEVLAFGPTGFRITMTNRRPIRTAADMQGMKIRVPEIPVFVETFKALGTNPTPMAMGETYTAIQTGVIDGMESPADGLWAFKIPEVTKYASKTYHMFTDMNLMMNLGKFQALSAAEQNLLLDVANDVVVGWYRQDVVGNDAKYWKLIAEKLEVVENPDIASFRAKTAGVYEGFYRQGGAKGKEYVEAVKKLSRRP